MAERPLYTLYKNLKAQNYDVPDDYNKFESALTRDGKGGADNRHAIYENLKAQNFDVPSTYERFYSALFEPRSKTSSRAKGGSVPMSAADRARFSAGAAAISASAQQTMNNAGRYNRLKQRKQKQQKDFGRVNLGTHQTPYGGDANNVVKDDFAYNPETGKTGAYVTSDNENAYSLPEAEQMQAILDKQNDAYQVAVDTGEIPSAFDVRDKNGNYDLQENIGKNGTYLTEEGAQKQFDKKLADAYARKKEIEALIAEDNRQHGNPLLSYGASIGASNGRTAEQSDYRNKLATSLSLVKQQIGALEAVKQYPTSSWGEDALKALDNTAFTAKTWDFGLTDFATMGQMERIKTKMDNNIPLSGSDKMLLKSKLGADAAAALEDEKMGNVYRWTKIAGQSLPFMADFFLTGGYGGITKGISRGALKIAAKRGMGKVSAAVLKNTGIVIGDIIGSYAMAGTEQALKTGADIMQRHLGNLYQDEKGDYKFGTFDENGNLLHEGGESIGTALYKGMTSAMVENYTEKLFGHNYGIKKGAVNFMEKHGMNASAEFFKNIGKSGWYTNSKKWMEKFGINGFAEEVMEEEIGIPLHALLDGEGKVSDLLDAKQQLDIIGGMAISVGSMYAMGAGSRPVKGIYNRAQYYRFRNKVNVADSDAQNLMGDNWADIKDKIDNATNEQMGGVLADILRQRDTMTKEQINAAVNYGVNLMKMRGYNIAKTAEMNAKEITNEPTTPEEQHQADIDNAYSEGHDADDADKHDIQIQQEDQMKTLAAALGISEQQLSAMSDEELESMTGQDDKLDQAIYDYQLSSARYQGVVDDAQDKVDLAAHQAEQRVDMYTDQSRSSVRNATIKASGGLEDYGVYIISGNIATHDDGSIDVSNSDGMILYYDPTTNSVEHADALMFAELGEELPADDVKAQAVADAKENAIKEVAGIIDGTVEIGSQFNVTDTDGTEHTYEVLADYGDGTAAISIDGNVVENPYSLADLQQMKDLEDQKRLEAAKAEREQMEKERAAQQNQETEETQPSFDFNQILNDNGNVVLVDVLDKDGNTKYPDSRLFLIRDAGAKAKVVELKSDGTIVPHAVNKEDVATISSMSLDEYKQAMPESSIIEDNSGEESDEDSQLANLGLPKGSEIWMSGDGFGRPKENTLSKVVGIDEQGSIILEDKDGKKWSASFDYINNHRELPPLDENTNIVNEENNQSESNAEENTPAPEQTPAMTLEDGTIVPMLEDGNPDFSKLTAEQTAELYDTQFGEDADSIVSGYVSDAKKALDKASNMTVKGKTFVEQKAAKDAKEKAIADAQAAYDSAIAIRDAYNERQLAKVEDTAEGRKELIEKARRKFARLKSAVKDDAEAVSQLYRETIGSLLHRLYDGTGIDVTDTTPLTAEEYVASNLGAHSLNYEGTETSKGVKQETGLSREDFAKTQLLAADGKGTTIDALVHSLWENRPSNLESLDTQDIRNALIGVLNSGFKASEARNFVENIRIAQAENILEEQKRAQEHAAYAEQHKAEPEAELKAKSDEKAELKAKSEEKLDNESSNESNDLSNETDNEKINDNINDNINIPEDATDENPLGAERDESDLPFSAKENGKQQTTAERAADVEKNKVDDMKVVDNIVGEKTRKAFERLAKMMGASIQWQYSDKLGNGWIQETTDADGNVHRTIFITLDSSIMEGAQFVFGHEMTHQIKNLNPAAYNELTQLVLDTYGSDAFDKAVDETMKRYSDAGFSGRNRDYYAEEVVADAVGEMIRDLNLAHTLAMKMSHPLLAAIHEILQKIKLAFFGTEYSDVTKNIIRSIEQAYVKTAKGEVTNSETGEDVSFSLRQKPEPKKKGIGYKVFVLKDGKLYPPMVANPDGAATPVGVWLDADAAPIAGESKTGRPQVKQGGKGTQGGSGKLAYRPGWHLGVVPYAIQFNRKDAEGNKTLFPKNFVFAEVEYAADVDYQEEARQECINPSGKYQHSLAGLKHLPTDGYYMYRTNPNPETDPWVITGAMKVNRILTRAEQAELVKNAGREPQQIQEGDIVTDDVVNSINQEIADAPKFSLKVYHGSGADFTEFDFDHMGEGAGSQVFGWGGYVTSSKKIGKSYANLVDANAPHQDVEYVGNNAHEYTDVVAGLFNGGQRDYDDVKEFLQNGYNSDKDNARKKQMLEWFESTKPSDWKSVNDGKRNLYEVDIPEDNGSNYLEWEKTLNEKQINAIRDALAKNGVDISSFENRGFKLDLPFKYVYTTVLPMMMHSKPKDVSKFLSSLGFTGIKYPAGTIMGGAEENDTNYVIFKPEDMRIIEHTKFSLRLKSAIEETETNPSDAQKESGNYKKGHIKFGGYDYTIENPKGSTRSGKDADGKEWKVTMHDTYGYIRGKFGKDGDHLDMFINDKADLDNWNGDVFVVDQVNPDGSFDEHKVMYGYDSMDDAKKAYLANYSDGWQGLGDITGVSKDEFDKWLDTSKRKLKPFKDYAKVKFSLKDIKPVGVGAFGNIYNQFRGNAKAAIEFLKKVRGGEAVGALHHKDIGDIDLVWGKEGTGHSDGYGLSKLVKYHPEVLDDLQEILNDMRVVSSSKNRVNLESETHKAGVRLTWDGERKSWLLTAFKKETSASDKRTDTAATSLEGDTALSQTEGSAAKIDNSSETAKENGEKFSLKDEKTLAGVHNISEEKLLKAIKQGGLANPSVAVIDSSRQDHKAYGGISLILPSDKIAKRTGKNAGTWQGDAYTPTYPEVEKQMSNKGAEKSSSDVLSVPKEMQHEVRNGIDRWLNGGDANSGLKYLFLHEKGVAPEPKMIQPKFSDEAYNELKFITAGDFNIYGIGKADAQKVLDMYIEAKFDGDKDLYEEKTKAWLERNKSIVDAGAKGGMRYAIAKENVELYDEYGFNYKGVQTFVRDVEYDHRKSGVDTNATLNEVEDYIKTNNLTDEFNTWLEGKEKEYGIKEVIFDGFTPSGNRRYVPNTLENVSKLMKKQGRNGATGAAVSFQNFAARLMPSYGTLKDIRSKKGLLTSDREKFDKFREKWSNVFFELGMKCQPDATGTFDDYGLARLSEAAMTSDPQAYLKKEYNVDFSDEDTKRLKEMVKAIKEEHPAMYFETKFERPVRFDEFSAAVVPTTTKKEVKEALKNAGVSIFEYDEKSDADRKRAFNEAINSSDNIRFSLVGERGAADIAEDLKSLNTPDEVDDAIKTAIDDMPSGWQMANKKMIHIAKALGENRKAEIAGEEPKFSLKGGTLIKAGTYFSGGGLVEEGLKGIIDPVVAVEYDEKISGVYRNNFGQHIVTADVRDVDPKELVKQIDGEVEYFHASPVCKNYSQAKSNHAEVELDKETAASTAEFINAIKPKVVTIENVKGYKDSEAMKTITDALDSNGYTWDADVYNAADYGGYTNRERLIVRAVRNGKLPEKPKKMEHKRGWYEAVADIIPTLTEKKNGVAPWMDIRLKADGIDWRNIDKPLYVMGSAYADGKIPHAFADELLPTLRTKSGDVIVMPDGNVYRAMGRVLARVSGVSDDYKMPFSENLSHTIIGNGIPTQLTEHVIAPLLTGSDPKFSIRTYHGTGAKFDKFDLSHALEGEGSETFGHGVYVTNSKEIGDNYAQRAKDRKGKFGFDYKVDMSADARQMLNHYINKNQDVDKGLENARQDLKSALEMFPDDETLKELSAILQKKNDEIAEVSNNAYRYDVDIPDDNGENYLGWNDSQNFPLEKWYRLWEITHHGFNEDEYFKDGGARYDKDRIERIIQMKLDSPENGMQKLPTLKGEELYQALRDFFDRERPWHGAELTSRALKEIGFIGIKYPAGLIHGGAKEGDYNYVIFDENNANIVGNTRLSLRYDQFEHDLNQWKKDNKLPKDAQRPTIPQRNAGESAVDFLRRVDEYRKQMALWKTAPTYEQHLLSDDTALGEFNRELQRGSVLKRIAFQDSMLAIRKAQEAIMKEVGVDRLNMAEDAYTAENRSHGKGKNEFEEYNNEFLQPLRKAYHQMKKILGDSYDNVRIYMMAKHGLESDAQMAFKMSLEADYEDVAQRSAAYKAYKGDMNRIINDSDLEFGRVDFNTWRQRDNALRAKYSPSYMNYRYDKNGIAYDYSGLSALFDGSDFEEAAYKLVKDIEDKYVTETHNLWDATNAATKKVLRDSYKAGMMSKDTYQYVRDMYSHYIPLRGWDGTTADQVWDYIGGGKGAFNQTLKKAHGRTSIADDPIAYIENMAESGILLNNKNWVKQHLMLLAQNHPTSLLTLSKAWYVKSVDDNGNEEWIPATPQITSQMDSNQVKAAIDAFEKKMEKMAQTGDATQKRDGLNIAYPQTHSEEREHEVRVMKDGDEYVIYVNGDPQLAQAMNNTSAHRVREIQSGKLDRAAAWLGRKMAAAYTSLSPLFIPSNYFRDLTMTLASTAIREDAKYNYLLRKNLATSWNLGFMLRDYQSGKLREKVSNGNATSKEQMFYDFMMNGGETGFVSSLDVEDLKKKFKNDLKDLDRWKTNPVKVGHTIMDGIEFLNRAIEDSNRFAVYMTSIQYGRSIDEAVNDAKDVTLNFNRKGTGEYGWQMIRNLYLFINPAVQSLQTLGALAKHHPFKFTAVTASWLVSGVLVPIVNAALMSLLGGDDDKDKYWQFTKWDRRNNLIMWVPFTHEYVKIPLAQEFRAFYGIGDMIASKMMGGELAEESWSQYAEDLLGQVVDMLPLDPTGYDGNIAVSLMPNAIRPVFELAFNVDFTGKPLFKETEYNKYDPNFTKAYVGTPDWLVRASKMVNSIGNDYPDVQQNSIDAFGDPRYNLNNPAVVDHVLSSYLGGAYTMGSQVLGLLTKSLNDRKEIKVADIPLVSKFVSNPDDRPVSKKQGDEFWDKKEYYDRASNTISKLKKQAKIDGDYSLLERFYGSEEYKTYKLYEKDVKDYKEARKKERAEESGDEYRPHQLNAEDIYNNHATPMDEFEDMKLKQLFEKLNSFKTRYDAIVDNAPNESDSYYNTNKAAIDAIDEISLDKQEISELKKGFLDDGKDAYNAEDMKQIRDLRKKILAVLEKANKVVVANQKAKAEK
jgi:site-specific DNA-cytosine methylase